MRLQPKESNKNLSSFASNDTAERFLPRQRNVNQKICHKGLGERESGGGGSGVVDEEENFPQIRKI